MKRRRKERKYSHAPEINSLLMLGSLREGEYNIKPTQYCIRYIRTVTGDILVYIYIMEHNVQTSLLTVLRGLRHIQSYVVETVVCPPCWRDQRLAVCTNRARLLRG